MTRVLHVLDQPGQVGETLALRLSVDSARQEAPGTDQHAWLLLGGEPMRDAARAVGLDDTQFRLLSIPKGFHHWVPGAQRSLQAVFNQADRIECWTVGSATLATRLGCHHAVPRFGQATLCDYARQTIDTAARQSPPQSRDALRERWGADEKTIIIALLADRPGQVDAREPLLATAFTHEILDAAKYERGDVRLLCHPQSHRRAQASELAYWLELPRLLMQDAALLSPWHVLAGCDVAFAPDPLNAGLSILWAQASGVHVVAPPEPKLPLLDELDNILNARGITAKQLTNPLTDWLFANQPAVSAIAS